MPPINDNFASATTISTSLPQTITGQTTVNATAETGEPSAPGFGSAVPHSVWYSFTPTHDATYRFRIYNTNTVVWTDVRSLGMGVYTGAAVNALTAVETKNASSGSVSELIIRIPLTGGVTYHLMVESPSFTGEGANAHAFNFDLDVSEITSPGTPPANDDLADAEDLGTDPTGVFSGSNIDATWEAWEDSVGYDQPSVWYRFSIDYTGTQAVSLTKTGSDTDWEPYGEIYEITSDPPADFTDLSYYNYIGDNVSPPGGVASTDVDWVPGDYVLIVTNWNSDGSWDDFDLEFQAPAVPPANDMFASRVHLPNSYKVCVTGSTELATAKTGADFNEPNTNPGNINPPYPSVWYEWTSPNYNNEPINFQIDCLGSAAGSLYLEVFTGTSLGGLTLISSDHNSGAGGKPQLTLNTNGDINYKIRVSSPAASWGDFNLNITAQPGGSPPANDNFANAILMTGYSDSESGTTVGATAECSEQGWGDSDETQNTVWYKWVPPQTGRVRVQIDSGTGASGTAVYMARGTTLANLQEIEFFSVVSNGSAEYDYLSVEGGVDYYFIVQGNGGYQDTFTLSFAMSTVSSPSNDSPSNATVISATTHGDTITQTTEGANWDTSGPNQGDFITEAQENITVWYKISPTGGGSINIDINSETVYNGDAPYSTFISVWVGDNIATAIAASSSIHNGSAAMEIALEAGKTYWILQESYEWATAFSWTYFVQMQDANEEGTSPSTGNGLGDFDSTTGGFVADDEDGEFVASGTEGYGTLTPFTDGHHPYGWWCRFDLNSTQGDFIYRYGQEFQYIEVFRATKENDDYESVVVIGHSNGIQTIGVKQSDGDVLDTGYSVWGANKEGVSGKVRIEVGHNGITIDGINFHQNNTIFSDTSSNQFVTFDFGITDYPGDGTSYVDIDPGWNFRYSNIRIHDNPAIGVMGSPDETINEVAYIQGWSFGDIYPVDYPGFDFNQVGGSNNPASVIVSPGDYDGYSLDCSVDTLIGDDLYPCGWIISPSGSIYVNKYTDPVVDSAFPGMSFRFYFTELPSEDLVIAAIATGSLNTDSTTNGTSLIVGPDGVISIKPSYSSAPIPFCFVELNTYYYIELQADTSTRTYATKIWFNNYYMGRFEATITPPPGDKVPNTIPTWDTYLIGKLSVPYWTTGLFSDITVGLQIRDIALTRRKVDRPIGPTVITHVLLDGTGDHNYPNPEDIPVNATNIAINSDFSGSVDGAGQPDHWTGYDRHDTSVPSGAITSGWLFQTFGDSILTVASDTSGPPGLESELGMNILCPVQNDQNDDYPAACYMFFPETADGYPLDYADVFGVKFWIKGPAGHTVALDNNNTGQGAWPGWNTHTLSGDWEYVSLWVQPNSVVSTEYFHNLVLYFRQGTPGDEYIIKDWQIFINPEGMPPKFWQTSNNGTTVTEIPTDDTTSYEKIDEFPPTSNSDHIYVNTYNFISGVRGQEDDGKTHLPPLVSNAYLEYTFGDTDDVVLGAKLLTQHKGFSGPTESGFIDWDAYYDGIMKLVLSDEDGNYRYMGEYHSKIAIDDDPSIMHGVQLRRPSTNGEWNLTRWNSTRLRIGFHDPLFSTSLVIYNDYSNAAVIEAVAAELLVYDRRLAPPPCARPIDLSRIRFRAFEANDID